MSRSVLYSALAGIFACLTIVCPQAALSQISTGTITGRVTDATGSVIVGANVELSNTNTAQTLKAISDGSGNYSFALLSPGSYSLLVSKPGFAKKKIAVTITVAEAAGIDLVLVAGNSETIQVEGSSTTELETQNSGLDFLISTKEVDELPLNGRNPYGLAALSPGIAPLAYFGTGLSTTRGALAVEGSDNFQTNGGVGGYNGILLDGVPVVVCCFGQPALVPSQETVDQFKVQTSVPPAQLGISSGGFLNIVTKTGTNQLHGDIYEFFRNADLDAAPFFTKRKGTPPIPGRNDYRLPHQFNQFGATVGGPVFIPKFYDGRGKTFFFFSLEGARDLLGSYSTTTVPTALERQGIFTEACVNGAGASVLCTDPTVNPSSLVYDPNSYNAVTKTRTPLGNNTVTNINPVAQAYLALYPKPNAAGVSNNYGYLSTELDSDTQFTIKVDHDFSPTQQAYARITHDWNTDNMPDLFNNYHGANSQHQVVSAFVVTLGDTWVATPKTVFNFHYNFAEQRNTKSQGAYSGYNPAAYGFSSNFVSEMQIPGLASMAVSGFPTIGSTGFLIWNHFTHFLGASAILQRGAHTITVGYDGRLIYEMEETIQNPTGTFSYGTTFTAGPSPNSTLPTGQSSFDSFAAFLSGYPTSGTIIRQLTVAWRDFYAGLYGQDDWRINPKLTLNLGLRYDLQPGPSERYNRWADFNPSAATPLAQQTGLAITGGAQFLGASGNPTKAWSANTKDFGPRVGFSYAPLSRLVVRGGYGILFLPDSQRLNASSSLGATQNTPYLATVDGFTPAGSITNPFPNGVLLPVGASAGVTANVGSALTPLVYKLADSYQQQWNMGIQQRLAKNMLLNLNYTGSHGVKQPVNANVNDLQPQYFSTPGDQTQVAYLQASVPNPFLGLVPTSSPLGSSATVQRSLLLNAFPQYYSSTYSTVQNTSVQEQYLPIGSETYNAMQVSVVKQGKGLTFSGAYIWSKLLGNISDVVLGQFDQTGNPGFQDYYFRQQYEKSTLATDIRNRVTGTGLYALPFGRDQRFAAGVRPWVNELIGGWKLNTIISVQSGYPLNLGESGQQAYSGTRPNYVPGVAPLTTGNAHNRLGSASTPGVGGWFNPAAFTKTLSFQLGNVPRSASNLRGPRNFQDDISLIKLFPIREQVHAEFRLEAFNALNKVEFGLPNTTLGSSSFGVITAQANMPRNVQLALKILW